MSATAALRHKTFSRKQVAIRQRLLELAADFEAQNGYKPPYWELVKLARTGENGNLDPALIWLRVPNLPRANGARKIGYPKPYQGRVQISVFPRSRQFHQFPVRRFVTVLRLEIGGQFKKSLSDRHLFPGKRLVSERSGCAHPFRNGSDPAERLQN